MTWKLSVIQGRENRKAICKYRNRFMDVWVNDDDNNSDDDADDHDGVNNILIMMR